MFLSYRITTGTFYINGTEPTTKQQLSLSISQTQCTLRLSDNYIRTSHTTSSMVFLLQHRLFD